MRALLFLSVAVSTLSTVRAAEVDFSKLAPHPRLFFPAKLPPADTPLLRDLDAALLLRGEKMLGQAPLERVLEGRRLLGVSRQAVDRIVLLAYLHRTTGKPEFLQQAEKELLAVASFTDWHPEHFLDVAEMTAAMAIGYDWLHDALPAASLAIIRDAIREKGLQAALGKSGTAASRGTNNWNPVCNGGITLGALAIAEDAPDLAAQLVRRAIDEIPRAMAVYEPDGVYPEGPGYWEYGITYNILFIAALDSALGSDFGLAEKNGFRKTPMFLMQATGPSGLAFNFSDGGDKRPPSPAMFWFAKTLKNPAIARSEEALLAARLADRKNFRIERFDPFFRLWHPAGLPVAASPLSLDFFGRGPNPVIFLRTSWDPATAVYLGIKAGTASASHGHMDSGSFVLDAAGLRWAADPRSREYNELETAGVNYWSSAQNSDRWKVWETGPFSHNTLTIDGQLHNVVGHCKPTDFAVPGNIVLDLTETLKGQVTQATRTFTLAPDGKILIRDELHGLKPGVEVRWAMFTPAKAEISGTTATLTQKGKTMTLNFTASAATVLSIDPCDEDQRPYRRPMPGYRQLVATFPASQDGTLTISTAITPP